MAEAAAKDQSELVAHLNNLSENDYKIMHALQENHIRIEELLVALTKVSVFVRWLYFKSNICKSMSKKYNRQCRQQPRLQKSLFGMPSVLYKGYQMSPSRMCLFGKLLVWRLPSIATTRVHVLVKEVLGQCSKGNGKAKYIHPCIPASVCLVSCYGLV